MHGIDLNPITTGSGWFEQIITRVSDTMSTVFMSDVRHLYAMYPALLIYGVVAYAIFAFYLHGRVSRNHDSLRQHEQAANLTREWLARESITCGILLVMLFPAQVILTILDVPFDAFMTGMPPTLTGLFVVIASAFVGVLYAGITIITLGWMIGVCGLVMLTIDTNVSLLFHNRRQKKSVV